MAEYRFDCGACTNKAVSSDGREYCLPGISNGRSHIVLHDAGGTKQGDYFTCDMFLTKETTPALYEIAYNKEAHDRNTERFWEEYRNGR